MNHQEATQLLAMVKVAYPNAYNGMDNASLKATVNMWAMSFQDVPYMVMEQAFNSLRMKLKFPPTVAEMAEEISRLYYETARMGDVQRQIGNMEGAKRLYAISDSISRFKNWPAVDNYSAKILAGNRLEQASGVAQIEAGQ